MPPTPTPPTTTWTRQFGTNQIDYANAVSADSSGNVYVAGDTYGALPGQASSGDRDAFLRKYDALGNEVWTRQFGTYQIDYANAVSADSSGNVYVAGDTYGALPGYAGLGHRDAFLRKYDVLGNEVWTRQFGTNQIDSASAVSADSSGNVYVAGYTEYALPGQASSGGGSDAFLRKYDAAGEELWTRQFGTNQIDYAVGVSVYAWHNVYVAGYTYGALPGQAGSGRGSDAFLRKYDAAGEELWTRQFGSSAYDFANAVSADPSGSVYVVGYTDGALPGQESSGYADAFLRKHDALGNEVWTRQFGTNQIDTASAVSADSSGNVYVVGYTYGALPGQANSGGSDVFLRKYDALGNEVWTRQFGTSAYDYAEGVSADSSGNVYVAGYTGGALPGQTSSGGARDAFLRKYDADGNS